MSSLKGLNNLCILKLIKGDNLFMILFNVKKFIEKNIDLLDNDLEKFLLTGMYILTDEEYEHLLKILNDADIDTSCQIDVKFRAFIRHKLSKKARLDDMRGADFLIPLIVTFNRRGEETYTFEEGINLIKSWSQYILFQNTDPLCDSKLEYVVMEAGIDPKEWFNSVAKNREAIGLSPIPGEYRLVG